MKKICECGKVIDKKDINSTFITEYDENGKLVFHVCMHNVVIVDDRDINMKNFLSGALMSQEYKVVSIES